MIKNPSYKFYQFNHKRADGTTCIRIVAVSSFAGKPVKAHADCHPNDEFDVEKGKELARARCARKVAEKRYKRAMKKCDEAQQTLNEATNYFENMERYFGEATVALNEAYLHEEALKASM